MRPRTSSSSARGLAPYTTARPPVRGAASGLAYSLFPLRAPPVMSTHRRTMDISLCVIRAPFISTYAGCQWHDTSGFPATPRLDKQSTYAGDTLLGMSPRSFSDASLADGGNPSQFRRVQAATLPHEWVTILVCGRKDMPRLTRKVLREQVGTAHGVPMRCTTTSRAAIHAPLGFVTVQATTPIWQGARTGLTGIGLLDQANGNPRRFRLVGDVSALASVRPEANLLLAFGVHPLAIRHVAHIADHQRAHLALRGPGDDGTTDFVLQVPGAALLFG